MGNQKGSYKLFSKIIEQSKCKEWHSAVGEWEIADCEEDDNLYESCICGKENLKYLYTIVNRENGNKLFPIGSSCIRKFEREELNEITKIREQLFNLLHAVEKDRFIGLSSEYFSRKLLKFFYEKEVFQDNEYGSAEDDYKFMLDMFNKRNEPTKQQQKKINAIIITNILPYLQKTLEEKIKR